MVPPQDVDGSSVSYREIENDGPPIALPVVFVHGAGISKHMWWPQLETLSEEYQVVAFDLPGHGTQSDTSFEFEAALSTLADVVTDLDQPVVLVGHSLGGYVVMEYAARHPSEVAGIVCSGSSADYRGWLGVRTRVTAALYRRGSGLPFVDRWFHNRTASQIRALPISEVTADAIIDGGFYLRSWGEAGSVLVGRDFQERLRQFEGPVLLVNGEGDSLNVPNAERLAIAKPNVESVVIDDVGHLCNLQAPDAYTDVVRRFLEEIRDESKCKDSSSGPSASLGQDDENR